MSEFSSHKSNIIWVFTECRHSFDFLATISVLTPWQHYCPLSQILFLLEWASSWLGACLERSRPSLSPCTPVETNPGDYRVQTIGKREPHSMSTLAWVTPRRASSFHGQQRRKLHWEKSTSFCGPWIEWQVSHSPTHLLSTHSWECVLESMCVNHTDTMIPG